jgi:hypothetical protein
MKWTIEKDRDERKEYDAVCREIDDGDDNKNKTADEKVQEERGRPRGCSIMKSREIWCWCIKTERANAERLSKCAGPLSPLLFLQLLLQH